MSEGNDTGYDIQLPDITVDEHLKEHMRIRIDRILNKARFRIVRQIKQDTSETTPPPSAAPITEARENVSLPRVLKQWRKLTTRLTGGKRIMYKRTALWATTVGLTIGALLYPEEFKSIGSQIIGIADNSEPKVTSLEFDPSLTQTEISSIAKADHPQPDDNLHGWQKAVAVQEPLAPKDIIR